MEVMDTDSRKRPLDGEAENSVTKKSNQGDYVHLKILVPASLAGVVLGKGGETIMQIQKETATNIKMSKGGDYYPGTTERVCLISGPIESVRKAHDVIMEKFMEKPEAKLKEELKIKILVPNVTVGMIIGKGGAYIRQIKDETGAYVQISQKSSDVTLIERSVTIAGTNDQMKAAFSMIFQKIVEDPQSGSCPNISYSDFKGPVANANPTGSPFAMPAQELNPYMGNQSGMRANMANTSAIDTLKSTLRGSGYSIQASEEITAAMVTLANYGLLGLGLGFGGIGMNNAGNPQNPGGLSLEYLSGILGGNKPGMMGGRDGVLSSMGMQAGYGGHVGDAGGMFYGDHGGGSGGPANESMFAYGANQSSYANTNQNSFGLGTGMGSFMGTTPGTSASQGAGTTTKELQVSENIVGAVLGHGGRAIVEIQKLTSANIQISKKGVFAPGTKNRVVTVTGNAAAVERAVYLVQQCIQQEEVKRSRQEQMLHQH